MDAVGKRTGMFAAFAVPAFRWIWFGALVSNVGNWMEAVAQSWLVQQQTNSPFLVELLAAAEFVPVVLLTLWAGLLADRLDRRKLLIAGQLTMMLFAALLAVLAHLGLATPWVVILLAFLEGAAWALVTPAWQSLVPALVPRDTLPAAIALNSAQFNVARLAGPMLAGALLTASGAALVFDLNVASFLAIVVALVHVQIPKATLRAEPTSATALLENPNGAGGGARGSVRGGILEAVRWATHERGPRRLLLGLSVFALLSAPVQGLLAVYADTLLHVGAAGYGALLSFLGAGAICGALSLSQLPRGYPRHHLIPLSMLGFSVCAVIYGSSQHMALSCAALAVGGVFWVWALASSNTAMQLLLPDSLRGRGMSVLGLATMGPLPLGHLLGGAIAHAIGPRAAVTGMTGLLACFALWSAAAREPGIDALTRSTPLPRPRGLRANLWEALSAASHRAQAVEPGVPPGNAEPVDRAGE